MAIDVQVQRKLTECQSLISFCSSFDHCARYVLVFEPMTAVLLYSVFTAKCEVYVP